MNRKLAQLLERLEPARTVDACQRRADEALRTFSAGVSSITDAEEFRRCIVRFGLHCDANLLCSSGMPEVDLDYAWGHYAKTLVKAYGRNGEKAAFEYARTGLEGGLYGVLMRFAGQKAKEYSENEIAARVGSFWNELSPDEAFPVMNEYLAAYGHLLSPELTERGAVRLKANFRRVLQEHPHMLRRLRGAERAST